MCGVCGCGNIEHDDKVEQEQTRLLQIETNIMAKNDQYAADNRNYFKKHNIFTLNLVSSPGAGKTTLLQNTLSQLKHKNPVFVIEGDQQTDHDAQKIKALDIPVIQINTGRGCHLDAHQIGHAVMDLKVQPNSYLFIENVGNLVCPAMFDLGESHKVVILSVTEGDDKPIKYPDMFYAADIMLINKIDLLPYVEFNMERAIDYAKRVNPKIKVLQTQANKEDGISEWLECLKVGCVER